MRIIQIAALEAVRMVYLACGLQSSEVINPSIISYCSVLLSLRSSEMRIASGTQVF